MNKSHKIKMFVLLGGISGNNTPKFTIVNTKFREGRCNDFNKLPLELNYRRLFLTYKINYGSLFYHYKKTTVIAKKLW